jgi:hypothetical protein
VQALKFLQTNVGVQPKVPKRAKSGTQKKVTSNR